MTATPETTERKVALPPGRLFIEGRWSTATGGTREVVDPATGAVVMEAAHASAEATDRAVTAARRAFDDGPWRAMLPRERGRILLRAAELMREHHEELAQLESLDTGKPITFSRMIDVSTAIAQVEYYGSLAAGIEGATRTTAMPTLAYTRREPIGVVAAITPFNFPLILSTIKIAPALAAGNTVVAKPSERRMASTMAWYSFASGECCTKSRSQYSGWFRSAKPPSDSARRKLSVVAEWLYASSRR
jgi:acyl-CoA reductase-like NAD-dependent aldehyde dehydrogenase